MPTIKFKLKNPKYCNGCDDLRYWFELGVYTCSKNNYEKIKLGFWDKLMFFIFGYFKHNIKRPQACIDKFGE